MFRLVMISAAFALTGCYCKLDPGERVDSGYASSCLADLKNKSPN